MKSFIPRHKFDLEAVGELKDFKGVLSAVDFLQLIEWLQDMHWPVSHPVAEFLRPRIQLFSDQLIHIFNGNDEEWKWNIITFLFMNNPEFVISDPLFETLPKIKTTPKKISYL